MLFLKQKQLLLGLSQLFENRMAAGLADCRTVPVLVHIDMKGGPPTLDYLLQLLPLLRSWGATGILVEWEDMFPYTGSLKVGARKI